MISTRTQTLVFWALLLCASASLGYCGWPALLEATAPPETPAPEPTGEPYADDYRHLTWLLREKWSWLELREEQGLDLEKLEREAIAICESEPGDRGFLRGLTRYIAGIHDGHG
ncbi:MAG: hypothetical protein ACI8Y8_004113, partial [Planctomycetota bacterium]